MFQPISGPITDTISEWEYKRLSNGKFMSTYAANKSLSQKLKRMTNSRIKLEFKETA